jgi:endonuclease G, mitochondrial
MNEIISMQKIPEIYTNASARLFHKHPLVVEVYKKIKNHDLRFLDEDNIKRRIHRLLCNPLIEKNLKDKGVADEFRSLIKLNDLSENGHSELERVINGSDFIPIWFLSRGCELRRTVARISVRLSSRTSYGTGFLIGPGVLITSFHVLDFTDIQGEPIDKILAKVTVEFDYEEKFDGSMQNSVSFALDYESLLLTSRWNDLDYVVVALKRRSKDEAIAIDDFGYNRLAGDLGKIAKGEPVYIIQHPNGQPKQLVLQNNRLIDRDDHLPYLTYEADTNFGTSGAPVYNAQWEVIALHHSAEVARDYKGNVLAKDGRVWQPDMGSAMVKFLNLNEGIRVSKILDNLNQKYLRIKNGNHQEQNTFEFCTSYGLQLLELALQTKAGAQPLDLIVPVPIENRPESKQSYKFSKPD